ncbi:PAS domain-containing protein [Pseudoneurospora amorphoporcata]|uniref:PAS domain-containing protein n=1 Tax=Pseudoneurospora amorphoporcata TaxID=241081 RepID=A0AAN6P344_9PEZI|nr:PAS domain-containing protein [Pseudoneurospora amorphoporcata]
MNNYYGSPLSPDEMQHQMHQQQQQQQQHQHQHQQQQPTNQQRNMMSPPTTAGQGHNTIHASDVTMSGGSGSLDEIIQQNLDEMHRRRSVPQPYGGQDRRLSMLDYANPNDSFSDYQLDSMTGNYGDMTGAMGMPGHSGPYAGQNIMAMSDHTGGYSHMSPNVMGNMMNFTNLNMYHSPPIEIPYSSTGLDSINTDFSMDMNLESGPVSASSVHPTPGLNKQDDDMMTVEQGFGGGDDANTPHQAQQNMGGLTPAMTPAITPGIGSFAQGMATPVSQDAVSTPAATFQSPSLSATTRPIQIGPPPPPSVVNVPTPAPSTSTPSGGAASQAKSIYSKSGFDMLRALWYVASRKDPKLKLGAVDMSCAFVVCDVMLNDCPIIYVSDNFQNLTGYSRHEIVGRNCRFLQAPDGNVEAGTKREFVENNAVYTLKKTIAAGQEIQQSLINYRKGGKPFLNLLTMIPIPWDTEEIRYFIGFQIDLVECPDAIIGQEGNGPMQVNYTHSDIGQYIWTPPTQKQLEPADGQTLGVDDVSTLLQQCNSKGVASDWHKQSWDKMLLENADDVVHVLSLKGLFLYLSPACKKVLEYDASDLVGTSLSSICHPSDIVPVTRELKEAQQHTPVNIVFRIRRKNSGYTWFESHGTLFNEQGKGRKCIILVGRKRPVFALRRKDLELNGGIGDSEIWTKVSTSGMFLFVSSNVRSLLDLLPETLQGTSMQDLMRKESRPEFGRTIEKARKGKIVSCKHEVQNKRGQVLQAYTTFYPGDGGEGQRPTFLLAQTKLLKSSSRALAPANVTVKSMSPGGVPLSTLQGAQPDSDSNTLMGGMSKSGSSDSTGAMVSARNSATPGQDTALDADNIFDELKTTRCTSWQYELRQMEKVNRMLAEELAQLLSNKKKRKRRKGGGNMVRDCANCHTRNTPEWRRGPSGNRDLCNSCGLRWAKQTGRVSPRTSSRGGNGDSVSKKSNSPSHSSPLHREVGKESQSTTTAKNSPSLRGSSTTPPGTVTTESGPAVASSTSGTGSTTLGTSANSAASTVGALGPPATGPSGGSPTQHLPPHLQGTHLNVQAMQRIQQHQQHHHHQFNPPQSQPLLEGGSGFRGGGMEMTSIREEMGDHQQGLSV